MQVCEQTFSWLSGYKAMSRNMGKETFIFFLTHMCHLRNLSIAKGLRAKNALLGNDDQTIVPFPSVPDGKGSPMFAEAKVLLLSFAEIITYAFAKTFLSWVHTFITKACMEGQHQNTNSISQQKFTFEYHLALYCILNV